MGEQSYGPHAGPVCDGVSESHEVIVLLPNGPNVGVLEI